MRGWNWRKCFSSGCAWLTRTRFVLRWSSMRFVNDRSTFWVWVGGGFDIGWFLSRVYVLSRRVVNM